MRSDSSDVNTVENITYSERDSDTTKLTIEGDQYSAYVMFKNKEISILEVTEALL